MCRACMAGDPPQQVWKCTCVNMHTVLTTGNVGSHAAISLTSANHPHFPHRLCSSSSRAVLMPASVPPSTTLTLPLPCSRFQCFSHQQQQPQQPGSARAGAAAGGGGLTSSANTAPSGHIALREVRGLGGGGGVRFTQCESPCSRQSPSAYFVTAWPSPSRGNLDLPTHFPAVSPPPRSGVCAGHEPRQSTLPGVSGRPVRPPEAVAQQAAGVNIKKCEDTTGDPGGSNRMEG